MLDSMVISETTSTPAAVAGRWRRRGRQEENAVVAEEDCARHAISSSLGEKNASPDEKISSTTTTSLTQEKDMFAESDQSETALWASYQPSGSSCPDREFEAADSSKGDLWSRYHPAKHWDTEHSESDGHLGENAYHRRLTQEQTHEDSQPKEDLKDHSWTSCHTSAAAWASYQAAWLRYEYEDSETYAPKDSQWVSYSSSQGYPSDSQSQGWESYHRVSQEHLRESNPWSSYQATINSSADDGENSSNVTSLAVQSNGHESTSKKTTTTQRPSLIKKWWHALEGESCPISLTPIETLRYEPFGLLGGAGGETAPNQGVWGKEAPNIIKSSQAVHWFDGAFLASFLVSGSSLIDPVNRRSLTRGECVSLDAYLSALHLPAVHVTDAYDLLRHVSGKSGSGRDPGRMAALEREAATLLGSLFDFRRNAGSSSKATKSSSTSSRAKPSLGPATGISAGLTATTLEPVEEATSQRPEPTWKQPHSQQQARPDHMSWPTLQSGSSLPSMRADTTVDKSHHDDRVENQDSDESDTQECERAEDPTPAEAMRVVEVAGASVGAANAFSRIPRTAPRSSRGRGTGPSQRTPNPVGNTKKSPPVPPEEIASRKSPIPEEPRFEVYDTESGASLLLCDVQVPDWASVELHERTLEELQAVEAMFSDEFELLTPTIRDHLEACVARGSVSSRAEALSFRLLHRIDELDLLIEFSLPPYYPSHSAMIELSWPESSVQSSSLLPLERAIRANVLQEMQEVEVVLAVLQWLDENGSVELDALRRCGKQEGDADDVPAPVQAAALEPSVTQENGLSKKERIEQARAERMAGKYSESWDLCYAFVKHGSCKDKNCAWRHAIPGKEKR